ncbi:MAG TPA: hypothetical protein ENK51_00290 [Gammaproteobacteria bacterium]|nr:hypothetical protein [Gammaproteobacteria bacterium]
MKTIHSVSALTLMFVALALPLSAQAGSERLIMVMSAQKMLHNQLVHVRFQDNEGHPLHSDIMKRLAIHRGDCDTGQTLLMPEDYKFGFSPKKEMGIYLSPQAWKDGSLCFSDPEFGQLQTTVTVKDVGQSIVRVFK